MGRRRADHPFTRHPGVDGRVPRPASRRLEIRLLRMPEGFHAHGTIATYVADFKLVTKSVPYAGGVKLRRNHRQKSSHRGERRRSDCSAPSHAGPFRLLLSPRRRLGRKAQLPEAKFSIRDGYLPKLVSPARPRLVPPLAARRWWLGSVQALSQGRRIIFRTTRRAMELTDETAMTEIMIHTDGRIFVFGLSREVAEITLTLPRKTPAVLNRWTFRRPCSTTPP